MDIDEIFKYKKTYHLPWTECVADDDKLLKDLSIFEGKEVFISEKLDGENTTMYPRYDSYGIHARSIDSPMTWWREWCRNVQINIADSIKGLRICGENMAAIHSIEYHNLVGFFYVFSIWEQETNMCLSLDETIEMCELLDLPMPKILYRGVWNEDIARKIFADMDKEQCEGYVVRVVDRFHYDDFSQNIAKAVRRGHVQTDDHWTKTAKPAVLVDEFDCKPHFMSKKIKEKGDI